MLDNVQINQKPITIRRALISVYDKTNIDQLAKSLINSNTNPKKHYKIMLLIYGFVFL